MPASRRHEARNWREETLAHDSRIRPFAEGRRVWSQHLAELRERDPELWTTVQELMAESVEAQRSLTYQQWSARALRIAHRSRRIYAASLRRQARSRSQG